MKILFTLIKFRNLYRVFESFWSEISAAATVHTHRIIRPRSINFGRYILSVIVLSYILKRPLCTHLSFDCSVHDLLNSRDANALSGRDGHFDTIYRYRIEFHKNIAVSYRIDEQRIVS
jgi:hypothetical protein